MCLKVGVRYSAVVEVRGCVRACTRARARVCVYLNDLAGAHGQRWEVSSAVDGDGLPQDRVQPLHLIPRQHAEPPTVIGRITARHGDVNYENPPDRRKEQKINQRFLRSLKNTRSPSYEFPLIGLELDS